jgi:hypothetical protein
MESVWGGASLLNVEAFVADKAVVSGLNRRET